MENVTTCVAPVEEKANATSVVAEAAAEAVTTDDGLDTGHKVIFYVLLGLGCILGLGTPVLIYFLIKKCKQCKQLTEQLNTAKPEAAAPEATQPATETKEAAAPVESSEKAPDKKEKK